MGHTATTRSASVHRMLNGFHSLCGGNVMSVGDRVVWHQSCNGNVLGEGWRAARSMVLCASLRSLMSSGSDGGGGGRGCERGGSGSIQRARMYYDSRQHVSLVQQMRDTRYTRCSSIMRSSSSSSSSTTVAASSCEKQEKKALVLVISGPSGVGKDAVIRRLQEKRPDIHFVVTATSREMRPGEQDGVDYYFVSKEQFEEWIVEDRLLEHAVVYGEYKGIPRQQVEDALKSNTDVVLRIDVQGAATMRRLLPEMVSIFLVAESEEALVQRLVDRKTEPEDKMKVRIETAREEMSHVDEFDYVVVNRDGEMENTVTRIEDILLAEKMMSSS